MTSTTLSGGKAARRKSSDASAADPLIELNLPMVWVTQGITDHAAYILKEADDGRKFVKWVANGQTQWVTADSAVKTELPKRRRRRKTIIDNGSDDEEETLPSNTTASHQKSIKKAAKTVAKKAKPQQQQQRHQSDNNSGTGSTPVDESGTKAAAPETKLPQQQSHHDAIQQEYPEKIKTPTTTAQQQPQEKENNGHNDGASNSGQISAAQMPQVRKDSSKGLIVHPDRQGVLNDTSSASTGLLKPPPNQKYPIGTKLYKEFPPFGWFTGQVDAFDGVSYKTTYEDGDSENVTEKEIDAVVVMAVSPDEDTKKEESPQQLAGQATSFALPLSFSDETTNVVISKEIFLGQSAQSLVEGASQAPTQQPEQSTPALHFGAQETMQKTVSLDTDGAADLDISTSGLLEKICQDEDLSIRRRSLSMLQSETLALPRKPNQLTPMMFDDAFLHQPMTATAILPKTSEGGTDVDIPSSDSVEPDGQRPRPAKVTPSDANKGSTKAFDQPTISSEVNTEFGPADENGSTSLSTTPSLKQNCDPLLEKNDSIVRIEPESYHLKVSAQSAEIMEISMADPSESQGGSNSLGNDQRDNIDGSRQQKEETETKMLDGCQASLQTGKRSQESKTFCDDETSTFAHINGPARDTATPNNCQTAPQPGKSALIDAVDTSGCSATNLECNEPTKDPGNHGETAASHESNGLVMEPDIPCHATHGNAADVRKPSPSSTHGINISTEGHTTPCAQSDATDESEAPSLTRGGLTSTTCAKNRQSAKEMSCDGPTDTTCDTTAADSQTHCAIPLKNCKTPSSGQIGKNIGSGCEKVGGRPEGGLGDLVQAEEEEMSTADPIMSYLMSKASSQISSGEVSSLVDEAPSSSEPEEKPFEAKTPAAILGTGHTLNGKASASSQSSAVNQGLMEDGDKISCTAEARDTTVYNTEKRTTARSSPGVAENANERTTKSRSKHNDSSVSVGDMKDGVVTKSAYNNGTKTANLSKSPPAAVLSTAPAPTSIDQALRQPQASEHADAGIGGATTMEFTCSTAAPESGLCHSKKTGKGLSTTKGAENVEWLNQSFSGIHLVGGELGHGPLKEGPKHRLMTKVVERKTVVETGVDTAKHAVAGISRQLDGAETASSEGPSTAKPKIVALESTPRATNTDQAESEGILQPKEVSAPPSGAPELETGTPPKMKDTVSKGTSEGCNESDSGTRSERKVPCSERDDGSVVETGGLETENKQGKTANAGPEPSDSSAPSPSPSCNGADNPPSLSSKSVSGSSVNGFGSDNKKPSFPLKLHRILDKAEAEGKTDIISWLPHGRAFLVQDVDRFVSEIMGQYFRHTNYSSFTRQLNLYRFQKIMFGRDKGAYQHENFHRGRPDLCTAIIRPLKGCSSPADPDNKPDFHEIPAVPSIPQGRSASTEDKTLCVTKSNGSAEGFNSSFDENANREGHSVTGSPANEASTESKELGACVDNSKEEEGASISSGGAQNEKADGYNVGLKSGRNRDNGSKDEGSTSGDTIKEGGLEMPEWGETIEIDLTRTTDSHDDPTTFYQGPEQSDASNDPTEEGLTKQAGSDASSVASSDTEESTSAADGKADFAKHRQSPDARGSKKRSRSSENGDEKSARKKKSGNDKKRPPKSDEGTTKAPPKRTAPIVKHNDPEGPIRKSRRIARRKRNDDSDSDGETSHKKVHPSQKKSRIVVDPAFLVHPGEEKGSGVVVDPAFLVHPSECNGPQESPSSSESEAPDHTDATLHVSFESEAPQQMATSDPIAPAKAVELKEMDTAQKIASVMYPDAPSAAKKNDQREEDILGLASAMVSMSTSAPASKPEKSQEKTQAKGPGTADKTPRDGQRHLETTSCPVCNAHIEALDAFPVDWSRPLYYPTHTSAIEAIREHTARNHYAVPIWNVLEATVGLSLTPPTGETTQNRVLTPVEFVKLALRHAVCCSYAIDESLLDMQKLRDMFVRRLGIARGFVEWSSDVFVQGFTLQNCTGAPVSNAQLRRSSLLLLAYLEEAVMEDAFVKKLDLTQGLARSLPFVQWRNMVQNVFLHPDGVQASWFMQGEALARNCLLAYTTR